MAWVKGWMLLLVSVLLVSAVSAATVTEKGSGIVRGSLSYQFEYDAADASPTIIEDVGANDLITIIHGITKSGLPIKYEMFFKTPLEGTARWDVLKGEKSLSMSLGETVEIDLQGDGTPELIMRYDAITERRRMSFTLLNANAAPPPAEPEEVSDPPSEEETVEEVVAEPTESAPPPVEEVAEPEVEALPDRVAPVVVEEKRLSPTIILIIIALIVVIAGWIYSLKQRGFFDEDEGKWVEIKAEETRQKETKRVQKEVKKEKPAKKAKPQMVTRSRRRR